MERIAILGGGPSALATAWHLSGSEALRNRFQIDVYTMGHRLGGKAASGRDEHGRILEHGLHILFGFYENFFRLVREAYAELDRPPTHPMPTWRHAFHPGSVGGLVDVHEGQAVPMIFEYPRNRGVPGDGAPVRPRDVATSALLTALQLVGGWRRFARVHDRLHARGDAWEGIEDELAPLEAGLRRGVLGLGRGLPIEWTQTLRPLRHGLLERLATARPERRAPAMLIDLWSALAHGLVADGVRSLEDLERLDDEDWDAWLERHGAHALTRRGAYGRSVYDAAFSFEDGDPAMPSVAAGSALIGQLLASGVYQGACYYKMQTGMGDAVFAPLYLALKRRGVRFHFFHRVRDLRVEGASLSSVELTRQVESRGDYQPLIDVLGQECWPEEPLHEQLVDSAGRRLESYWDEGGVPIELRRGRDFDRAVFAIPIGAVPHVASDLVAASPRWAAMVEHVRSITTIGVQVWMDQPTTQLGWELGEPLVSCGVQPLPTWADMSQVLKTETWEGPQHVSYLCGTQAGPTHAPLPKEDPDFPHRQHRALEASARAWIPEQLPQLLPGLADGDRFRWERICDPAEGQGESRFEGIHLTANCEPHERCTLALPGSTRFRLRAQDSGFEGLVLAGDWIANGVNMACVEGAVTSGVLAAEVLVGQAIDRPSRVPAPRPRPGLLPPLHP